MNNKISLYISAVALLIAVVSALFFFNTIQKMKKTIKDAKIDKGSLIMLNEKVDVIYTDIESTIKQMNQLKHNQERNLIDSEDSEDSEGSEGKNKKVVIPTVSKQKKNDSEAEEESDSEAEEESDSEAEGIEIESVVSE